MSFTATLSNAGQSPQPKTLGGLRLLQAIRRDAFQFFTELANHGAPYHWLNLGGSPVLFLADPLAVRHVFQGEAEAYHKSKYYQHLAPILKDAMLTSEEVLWRSQRQAAAPSFAASCYEGYLPDIEAATVELAKRLKRAAVTGQPVDIYQECLWLALDIVFRSFFHEDDAQVKDRINEALGTMLRMAERRVWSVVNLPMPLVVQFPVYRRSLGYLRELTESLIKKRQANRQYPEDLLSRFIALYQAETPEAKMLLRNNILAVIIAGHETTASNLAWAFYELARHPQVRRTAQAEVDRVLADRLIQQHDLKSLSLVNHVLSEALRLYPPVWTVSRDAVRGDVVPLTDGTSITVQAGTTVMLCAFALHRIERYWEDPESFVPTRFEKTPDKGIYFPFGSGHRTCIGMQFAKVETAICLARVLQAFDFTLIPGQCIRPEPTITLRPDRPIYLRVRERTLSEPGLGEQQSGSANQTKCPGASAIS